MTPPMSRSISSVSAPAVAGAYASAGATALAAAPALATANVHHLT